MVRYLCRDEDILHNGCCTGSSERDDPLDSLTAPLVEGTGTTPQARSWSFHLTPARQRTSPGSITAERTRPARSLSSRQPPHLCLAQSAGLAALPGGRGGHASKAQAGRVPVARQ